MKRDARFFSALVFLLVLLYSRGGLFAFGKKEEPAPPPLNTEWTLCVTSFDVSALSPRRQITGDTVVRSLAGALPNVDFRFRGEEESAWYRDYAWAKSRAANAKALEAKRVERDLLLYKGDSAWRYRKNLKAVDEAIVKLEEELAAIDAEAPPVEKKPLFRLAEENKNGVFPGPPVPGGEYRFCADKKADALLAGSLSEYHGRIYLNIKMYTLYTRSWSFEDSVLFSPEDLNAAMDELSGRLAEAVSKSLPASVLVHASPDDAMVIIDGSFAGRGETEARPHSPGEARIELSSDNHVPVSFPLELNAGELAELFVELTPLGFNSFEADVSASPGSRVYLGGLYVGEAPYTLRLPAAALAYISVETPEGETGSVIYRDNDLVRGNAEFVWQDDFSGSADFFTRVPVSPEEKRVDRARRGFYGAYGVFWIALPVALLSAGIAGTYIGANNYAIINSAHHDNPEQYQKNYDNAVTGMYVRGASYGMIGVSLGITFFQIFRYLYVSGGDATPIVKSVKNPDPEAEAEN